MSVLIKPPEFDHYVVTRVLGEGGMGIVFLGEDRRTSLPVAIKVMSRAAENPELQARFMQENQILSSLNHRNIVRCYDITCSREGLPSIVMEYLLGAEFGAFEGRPFPELMPLMVQAAMGLGYLKERSILHRDLSPNNVLVTLSNQRRLVKILDFGVAKILQEGGEGLTQTGEFLGKLAYASPELLTLSTVDFRSDIYSLGVIFFRLLTARRPINVQNTRNYLEWVRAHEARVPLDFAVGERCPPLPARLKDLVRKMLERQAEDRPQGYEEIIDTLVAVQADAEKEGLVPDPVALATLPTKGDEKQPAPPSAPSASPAGSSVFAPASSTAAGMSASAFFDDAKFSFGGSQANEPDPFSAETSAGAVKQAEPAPNASESDWLQKIDYSEEMKQVAAARGSERSERAAHHPLRVVEERARPAPAVRREITQARSVKKPASASFSGVSVGLLIGLVVLGGGGFALWKLVLEPGGSPGVDVARRTPLSFDTKRAAVPTAPSRAGSAASGAHSTAEGRRLVSENVVGFLITASHGHAVSDAAAVLVRFRKPVNVSGLSKATLAEARDASGKAIPGLEGTAAEIVAPDDPTGTMRLRFLLTGDLSPGDPRVQALRTVVVRVGPGTFRAKLEKGLLSD